MPTEKVNSKEECPICGGTGWLEFSDRNCSCRGRKRKKVITDNRPEAGAIKEVLESGHHSDSRAPIRIRGF